MYTALRLPAHGRTVIPTHIVLPISETHKSAAAAPSTATISPPWTCSGIAAPVGAVVLAALAEDREEVLLAVAEEREDTALLLLVEAVAELAELALLADAEARDELAEDALDSEAEDAEAEAEAEDAELLMLAESDEVAAVAVEATSETVLVAPWTWKPPLKLYSEGFASSMIWTKTWPMGTSGGTVKVALPVLGMFSATIMPSLGWMSPLV